MQARRQADAGGAAGEGNEEVMIAGQARLGHLRQHLAHHAAQGLAGQDIVADQIFGHGRNGSTQRRESERQ